MREIGKGNGVKPGRKDNQGFIGFKLICRILQSIHCQDYCVPDYVRPKNP